MTIRSAITMCSKEIEVTLGNKHFDVVLDSQKYEVVLRRVGFALAVLAEGLGADYATMDSPTEISDDDISPDLLEDQAEADRRADRRIRSFWG